MILIQSKWQEANYTVVLSRVAVNGNQTRSVHFFLFHSYNRDTCVTKIEFAYK